VVWLHYFIRSLKFRRDVFGVCEQPVGFAPSGIVYAEFRELMITIADMGLTCSPR